MKKFVIYEIKNIVNNFVYVGVHMTNDINDDYMGSGVKIKEAICKFGIENFKKTILHVFDNKEDALLKEYEIVNESFLKRNDVYNLTIGGGKYTEGFVTVKDKNGKYFRVHRSDSRYISGELQHILKGRVNVKDENGKSKNIDINDPKYQSGELIHYNKNIVPVKDKRGNNYCVDKNDPMYLSGELTHIWKNRKHSKETKMKMSLKAKEHIGEKNSQYGTCWITNGKENKKIKKEDFFKWLNDGWIKGRKMAM